MLRPIRAFIHGISVSFVVATAALGCSAPPPNEELRATASDILTGRVLTAEEVAGHVRAAGFAGGMIGTMTCVAKYESSFFERAQNGVHRGLFQISSAHLGREGCPRDAESLFDAATNARCARAVYDAQGIHAWTAYDAHRAECDSAATPEPAAEPGPSGETDASERPEPGEGPSCGDLVAAYEGDQAGSVTGLCEQHDVADDDPARHACGGRGRTTWDCDVCCRIVAPGATAPL